MDVQKTNILLNLKLILLLVFCTLKCLAENHLSLTQTIQLDNDFFTDRNVLNRNTLVFYEEKNENEKFTILKKLGEFKRAEKEYPDNEGGTSNYWIYFKVKFSENCPDHIIDIHSPNARR